MTSPARLVLSFGLIASLALLAACGDDDGDQNNNHVMNNNNMMNNNNQVQTDAAVGQDSSVGTDASTGTCDHTGYTAADEYAAPFDTGGGFRYHAVTSTSLPVDVLDVQVYTATEYNPPTAPGTYSLTGSNFQTCGLCLLIFANCDNVECEKTYFADEGSVEITSLGSGIGDTFAANLQNVVFKEVTIDDNTYLSTPVPGGDTWCVNGYSYSEELVDPNAATCGSNDVNCVGEDMTDFSLTNCQTGNPVSMQNYATGADAFWIVGTHAWCSACSSAMPGFLSYYDSNVSNGLQMAVILGENAQGNQPTLAECRAYAAQYSGHEQLVFMDHDGQYSHALLFSAIYPYPDDQQMIGFPWQAVVDPQNSFQIEYVDNDGSGSDAQTTINSMLP